MPSDIRQDIKNLENDILQTEDNIVEFLGVNLSRLMLMRPMNWHQNTMSLVFQP